MVITDCSVSAVQTAERRELIIRAQKRGVMGAMLASNENMARMRCRGGRGPK